MTGRDRMVAIAVAVLAILGATWVLLVSPERQKATKVTAEVTAAKSSLTSAESQLASARTAQAGYATAYAAIVNLGKAVPANEEVPSLIYQLAQATEQKHVEFASITAGGSASSSAAAPSAAAASVASAGFSTMPFTFIFNGGFFELERLFQRLDGFARRTAAGGLSVSGRLLTVQSVKLAPVASSGTGAASSELAGTITASAYQLPASQGLTGSATATSPTGAATPAASTAPATSATAPATVKVNP